MKKIIVLGGSFNPITIAHREVLKYIVRKTNSEFGVFVPSNQEYVAKKIKNGLVLTEELRLKMIDATIENDSNLIVDDLEYHQTGKWRTVDTLEMLQSKYPDMTICFLIGSDKLNVVSRWHRAHDLLTQFKIVVMKRNIDDPLKMIQNHPFLSQYQESFEVIDELKGYEEISSSKVRECLENHLEYSEMVDSKVKYLLETQLPIMKFRNEYRFLSNFYEVQINYQGLTFQNAEAAFQAQKTLEPKERLLFQEMPASKSKYIGSTVQLRSDWEEVKVQIMEEIVRAKFYQNEYLKQLLLATGDRVLIEGNTWNDTFWGVNVKTGKGQNHLGQILMKIRAELKNEM